MQACRESEGRPGMQQGVDSEVKKRKLPSNDHARKCLRAYLQSPPDKSNSRGSRSRSSLQRPASLSLSLSSLYPQQPVDRAGMESYTSKAKQHTRAPSLLLTALKP
jgi:hypothetical protein